MDDEVRQALCAWLRGCGVDPDTVPDDAPLHLHGDGWAETEVVRFRADGSTERDGTGTSRRYPHRFRYTEPLPNLARRHLDGCPTCGRPQDPYADVDTLVGLLARRAAQQMDALLARQATRGLCLYYEHRPVESHTLESTLAENVVMVRARGVVLFCRHDAGHTGDHGLPEYQQ